MSIATASLTLLDVLAGRYRQQGTAQTPLDFKLRTAAEIAGGLANEVSLWLYRADVDQTRRHVDVPRPRGGAGRAGRWRWSSSTC